MRTAGLVWGLLAGVGYALTYLCLRAAVLAVDPLAAALVRAIPVLLLGWGLLLWQRQRGTLTALPRPALLGLSLVGIVFNVAGNGAFQLALILAGLVVTVPVSSGAILWGGALVGWWLMGETIGRRTAVGLLLLVLAVPLLSSGPLDSAGSLWLGALAATVAGLAYGGGNAMLRRTVLRYSVGQAVTLTIVPTSGALSLLGLVLISGGTATLTTLAMPTLAWLLMAGLCNAFALMALAQSLTRLPVARANALYMVQTALAALGGVLLFAEPITWQLLLGLLLTAAGVLLSQRGDRQAAPPPSGAGSDRVAPGWRRGRSGAADRANGSG